MTNGRLWTSFLINDHILFDVAPTAPIAMKRLGKDINKITHIFITHFHGDHVLGLPFLLGDYAFQCPRNDSFHIIGPPRIREHVKNITEMTFPGVVADIVEQSKASFIEIRDEGISKDVGGINFTPLRMRHFKMESYGYRVRINDRIVAFSGDTGECENLYRLVQDAPIIVLEMNSVTRDFPYHLNLKQITNIRSRTPRDQKIIVTHMEENEIPPISDVIISEDLREYEL